MEENPQLDLCALLAIAFLFANKGIRKKVSPPHPVMKTYSIEGHHALSARVIS
jgi:hypothetical protein